MADLNTFTVLTLKWNNIFFKPEKQPSAKAAAALVSVSFAEQAREKRNRNRKNTQATRKCLAVKANEF